MPKVKLGWPEWKPGEGDFGVLNIPPRGFSDIMDIGETTAHEIGHFVMQGHSTPKQGRQHIKDEVEAWAWQVSKTGLTDTSKEYFYDEILEDAEEHGVSREELADIVLKAIDEVEKKRGKKR